MKDWEKRIEVEDSDELLEGIEQIGISDKDRNRLEKKVLMRAGIGRSNVVGRPMRHTRRTALLVAALLVCTIAVFAASRPGALNLFWGEDSQKYTNIAGETNQSVETKDIRLSIEGIAADKYQCVFILTAEALTHKGEKILKDAEDPYDHEQGIQFEGIRENKDGIETLIYDDVNAKDNYKTFQCRFPVEKKDYAEPIAIRFAGVSMTFDLPKLETVTRFYPDGLDQKIPYIDVSSLGYYYMAKELTAVKLIKKDGTLEGNLGYHGGMKIEDNQTGSSLVCGWFTELIAVTDYKGVQVNGVAFDILSNEKK